MELILEDGSLLVKDKTWKVWQTFQVSLYASQ
jgi:hypothetical protein